MYCSNIYIYTYIYLSMHVFFLIFFDCQRFLKNVTNVDSSPLDSTGDVKMDLPPVWPTCPDFQGGNTWKHIET